MSRDHVTSVALTGLVALSLTAAFWPAGAIAKNDKIDQRDAICAAYKGTALWGQCTRAVVHNCQDSTLAAPQCEGWAQIWRDDTGDREPPWLLLCGGGKCVFVTEPDYTGDLRGLAGADATCQSLAKAQGSLAARGVYKAWLSDSSHSPSDRFTHASVPYKLVDGTTIADDWTDLTSCNTSCLAAPLNLDAAGEPVVGNAGVWTRTATDGSASSFGGGPDCEGWSNSDAGQSGEDGFATSTDETWTGHLVGFCNAQRSLYCFEQ